MKQLMTGNEAIARGAYEAGVKYASAYPGTPSTEILENIALYKEDIKALEFRYSPGMATVFLTNFIRCRTSFRMLFRLSLTMSLLGCDDLRQELTVKVRLPR